MAFFSFLIVLIIKSLLNNILTIKVIIINVSPTLIDVLLQFLLFIFVKTLSLIIQLFNLKKIGTKSVFVLASSEHLFHKHLTREILTRIGVHVRLIFVEAIGVCHTEELHGRRTEVFSEKKLENALATRLRTCSSYLFKYINFPNAKISNLQHSLLNKIQKNPHEKSLMKKVQLSARMRI